MVVELKKIQQTPLGIGSHSINVAVVASLGAGVIGMFPSNKNVKKTRFMKIILAVMVPRTLNINHLIINKVNKICFKIKMSE